MIRRLLLVALLLPACAPDPASDDSPDDDSALAALSARLDALEARHATDVAALEAAHAADVAAIEARLDAAEAALAAAEEAELARQEAELAQDEALAALDASMAALGDADGDLPASVTRLGDVLTVDASGDLVLSGVNLYVRSGEGSTTAVPNGKGNIVLGYGESLGGEARTGSHTLVVGPWNDWTGQYGLVVGQQHALLATGAGILGGEADTVTGEGSVAIAGTGSSVTHARAVNLAGSGLASMYDCGVKTSGVSSGSGC